MGSLTLEATHLISCICGWAHLISLPTDLCASVCGVSLRSCTLDLPLAWRILELCNHRLRSVSILPFRMHLSHFAFLCRLAPEFAG